MRFIYLIGNPFYLKLLFLFALLSIAQLSGVFNIKDHWHLYLSLFVFMDGCSRWYYQDRKFQRAAGIIAAIYSAGWIAGNLEARYNLFHYLFLSFDLAKSRWETHAIVAIIVCVLVVLDSQRHRIEKFDEFRIKWPSLNSFLSFLIGALIFLGGFLVLFGKVDAGPQVYIDRQLEISDIQCAETSEWHVNLRTSYVDRLRFSRAIDFYVMDIPKFGETSFLVNGVRVEPKTYEDLLSEGMLNEMPESDIEKETEIDPSTVVIPVFGKELTVIHENLLKKVDYVASGVAVWGDGFSSPLAIGRVRLEIVLPVNVYVINSSARMNGRAGDKFKHCDFFTGKSGLLECNSIYLPPHEIHAFFWESNMFSKCIGQELPALDEGES